jgi:hypothetical protein
MNNNNNHETEFDYFGDQFDNDIDYNSKINTTMKANTILTRTNTYIEVESYKGEKRRIHLPKTIAKEAIYIVRGKIRMGDTNTTPKPTPGKRSAASSSSCRASWRRFGIFFQSKIIQP